MFWWLFVTESLSFDIANVIVLLVAALSFISLLFSRGRRWWSFSVLLSALLAGGNLHSYRILKDPQYAAEIAKQEASSRLAERNKVVHASQRIEVETEEDLTKHNIYAQNKVSNSPNRRRDIGEKIGNYIYT